MKNNREDAIAMASAGLQVFPIHSPVSGRRCDCPKGDACTSPAKHPRTMHGLADATADAERVDTWWRTWPHANIGVATGPGSGLVVLDIDPRHGGDAELVRLMQEYAPLPDGPAYETGSGGSHYWFRHPGFKITSRNGIGPGIDVKGDGGYVIVPPSVHSTGGAYEWYEGCGMDRPRPEIPAWVMSLMQRGDGNRDGSAPIAEDVVTDRNNTLASLGGTLRNRGLSEPQIFKLLMALNETWSDPLDAVEVGKVAASVARYEPGQAATTIVIDTGAAKTDRKLKSNVYIPVPYTAASLMSEEIAPPKWAVEGLLPEGLAILAGKPKLGKSWMSFNISLAIAQGGIVMGRVPVEDGEVLVLALEDNKRRLQGRLKQMLDGECAPERMYIETSWPREDDGGIEVLDAWLGQHPMTRLVVIDTLAKFRKRGVDSKYAEDYAAIEGLQELAGKHGICILLITHFRKALSEDGDWVDQITGTLGVAGAADTLWGLTRSRSSVDAILHIDGRDVNAQDLALKWDLQAAQWTIMGDADEYAMGIETQKLVVLLRENGAPMKVNDIASRTGKKRDTIHKICARASTSGAIKNYGGGLYGANEHGGSRFGSAGEASPALKAYETGVLSE